MRLLLFLPTFSVHVALCFETGFVRLDGAGFLRNLSAIMFCGNYVYSVLHRAENRFSAFGLLEKNLIKFFYFVSGVSRRNRDALCFHKGTIINIFNFTIYISFNSKQYLRYFHGIRVLK